MTSAVYQNVAMNMIWPTNVHSAAQGPTINEKLFELIDMPGPELFRVFTSRWFHLHQWKLFR